MFIKFYIIFIYIVVFFKFTYINIYFGYFKIFKMKVFIEGDSKKRKINIDKVKGI